MASVTHVFNQYYWDLLKKVKDLAKDRKYKAESDEARNIIKEIKKNYMSFDKGSSDHLSWYNTHVNESWTAFAKEKHILDDWKNWYEHESVKDLLVYNSISVHQMASMFKSKDILLYYMILLSLFANLTVQEHVAPILDILKKKEMPSFEEMSFLADESMRTSILVLQTIASSTVSANDAPDGPERLIHELENTTLGKLAKEIMDEVNVQEIQNSIGENGDIMKAFADPNGGLSKLIGTVSQKMISKLASGELKQDTLLNEAMKLAGSLPNMGGLGNMGSMLSGLMGGAKGDDDDGGFDFASMMKSMMGGKSTGGGKSRVAVNTPALTRNVKAKQLRKTLEQRRKAKENIETHVGDDK